MRLLSVLTIFTTLVLISACSSNKDGMNGGGSASNGGGFGTDGINGSGISGGELGEIQPGTQEELVAAIGDRVFFDFNSSSINGSAQNTLRRQAEWLLANPAVTVSVEGHCDERGTREFNLALGERRANSVRDFLISQGIVPSRVSTISYGKEHPEYLGSNEAAWSKNRRGVTVVNN